MKHVILLRETQPNRFEAIAEVTDADLRPLAVMHANMEFFHRRAAEVIATIPAMPPGANADADQLQAMKDLADAIKMREMAQLCARDLAKYIPPMSPKPPGADLGAGKRGPALEFTKGCL